MQRGWCRLKLTFMVCRINQDEVHLCNLKIFINSDKLLNLSKTHLKKKSVNLASGYDSSHRLGAKMSKNHTHHMLSQG